MFQNFNHLLNGFIAGFAIFLGTGKSVTFFYSDTIIPACANICICICSFYLFLADFQLMEISRKKRPW